MKFLCAGFATEKRACTIQSDLRRFYINGSRRKRVNSGGILASSRWRQRGDGWRRWWGGGWKDREQWLSVFERVQAEGSVTESTGSLCTKTHLGKVRDVQLWKLSVNVCVIETSEWQECVTATGNEPILNKKLHSSRFLIRKRQVSHENRRRRTWTDQFIFISGLSVNLTIRCSP